jgi:hypothetical protein
MPIAGSIYNAEEIASMSAAEFQDAQKKGQIPQDTNKVKQSMQQQNPNILIQLSDELKQYFEQNEQEQESDEDDDTPPVTPEEIAEQEQRFKDFQHEPPEIERVVNKGLEKSPATQTHRITKTTSHSFNGPNVDKAFKKGKTYVGDSSMPKQKVSRSGGAATGKGFEEPTQPPTPNGWPGRKPKRASAVGNKRIKQQRRGSNGKRPR